MRRSARWHARGPRAPWSLLAASLVLGGPPGCREDDAPPVEPSADPGDASTDTASTGVASTDDASTDDAADYEVPFPEPPDPAGDCEPGQVQSCPCDDGAGPGTQICLPNGRFSACGCGSDDPVYEPPPPPEYEYCGDTACPPYPFPPSDYAATHCCTPDGACGSTNESMFAASNEICLTRGADSGTRSPDCPDQSIAFVDMLGCCMPTGQCGFAIDETFPNWDVGCIERSEWTHMLSGTTARWWAALLFGFDPAVPEWASLACTPSAD